MSTKNTPDNFFSNNNLNTNTIYEIMRLNSNISMLEADLREVKEELLTAREVISETKEGIIKFLIKRGEGKILEAVMFLKCGLGISISDAKSEVEKIRST